jgi:hypothetical protein
MVTTAEPDTECWRKHALASLTALQSEAANPKIEASAREELDALLSRASEIIGTAQPALSEAERASERECWSADGEMFNYSSLGDLLDSDDDLWPGRVVYKGMSVEINPKTLCDADDVIELIGDRAGDFAGEAADDYPPTISKAAKDWLNTILKAWIVSNAPVTFWSVKGVTEVPLTVDDFDDTDPRREEIES